jgi:signal transduction histidine kinase
LKYYSLLRRITIVLTATIVAALICGFGWLYFKTKWTDAALHQEALLDQAHAIASYLSVDKNGSVALRLPPNLAEAYSSPESAYRYVVREATGRSVFESGPAVGPLPVFSNGDHVVYNYDPDGTGPFRMTGAALRARIAQRVFFVQVERQAESDEHLKAATIDEFMTDGGWLGILFMLFLLGASIWLVKDAIAPLNRVSQLAETIGPDNLNVRLPIQNMPAEILPLILAMNSALDRLAHALQLQREFIANAAHQLRTPLAVLMANIYTLQNPQLENRIRVDVEHMSRIVSQLLLDARLDATSFDRDEVIELNAIAADIAASYAPFALACNKTVELLRSNSPVNIRTSDFAVRTALGNLIENAISHTPAGATVRVSVTERPSIEVMDSGPGIPAEQYALIFKRFWQADRNSGGAGLGLSIVHRIMTALHGYVRVDDGPGGGALFTLVFPADAVERPDKSILV